jgi:hypothetical protein
VSETYFEFPVRIVSRAGCDTMVAKCNGCTASSTQTMEIAMQRAAAKALNKSGRLAVGVVATEGDILLVGEGRSRSARYVLGATAVRKCRVCGCTEEDCSQCVAKTGEPCHWVGEDLCSACVPAEGLNRKAAKQQSSKGRRCANER